MMTIKPMAYITVAVMSLLMTGIAHAADQLVARGEEAKLPDGVVGVSLHIGADRVGDPALLYIGRVHPEGPAAKAGLRHGDELVTVDGTPVSGKSYEQVVKMVRGEAGTNVKLGVKRENDGGVREVSLTRIASEKFSKGSSEHGTYKEKP